MMRFTFKDFHKRFPDDDACLDWLMSFRHPAGVVCKNCQRITKHHRDRTRKSYSCDACGNHVHPTAGTIFHKSSTSLQSWFHAIFLLSSTRCGISAKQLERETGVTYKTAWRMFKQIRTLLEEGGSLYGEVEVDESYYGGRRRGKRGRGAAGKTIVAGAVERGGRVIAQVVPDVKKVTLTPFVQTRIMPSSTVYTDELPSYNSLGMQGYVHKRVHHAAHIYVDGDASTNTIEGFWSLTKRGIGGVFHAVSAKYLQTYLNEYSFRYNHRKDGQAMFETVLARISWA